MLVMLEIMDVLSANPNIILDDTADASEERTAEPQPNEKGEIRVWGNLVAYVERLDDEMFKSLQVSCRSGLTSISSCSVAWLGTRSCCLARDSCPVIESGILLPAISNCSSF